MSAARRSASIGAMSAAVERLRVRLAERRGVEQAYDEVAVAYFRIIEDGISGPADELMETARRICRRWTWPVRRLNEYNHFEWR